jgi:hypothetical protein
MNYGFVYVMTSAAFDGLYKVGFTTGSPFKRAAELGKSTSSPHPFEVICYAEFENAAANERRIHFELDHRRVSARREFFEGPFSEIYVLVMDRDYALSLCDHHAAVYLWDEEHAGSKVLVGGFQ